jgi:peptidyl-prolyl cis-trans isomerase SurA
MLKPKEIYTKESDLNCSLNNLKSINIYLYPYSLMKLHESNLLKSKAKNLTRTALILLLVIVSNCVSAQKKNDVVVTIGDNTVTKEEFEANYRKNNTNILDEKDKKTPAEYMDMYVSFKLKVIEAQKLGYDTAKAFVTELKGYRQELAKPYLTNVAFNEEMVKNAYYRTTHERKASHILIRVDPEASPADTLAAWNKLTDIRNQILAGADFNEMAVKYSEDPSAAQNKGLLGYFAAFQMVYPFEDMTYKTPVGEVSQIARTRYGYHLIKVLDERPTSGEMHVAHIMKLFPKQASEETIANLKLAADSIWQKATSGGDFAELAKKYSDDKRSSVNGGTMNWFTKTTMIPEFADAAFALQKDGDISPVIRTPYGWHIIKRLELRAAEPFEKMRPDLEAKIKQNPAFSKSADEAFDKKLRVEYQLKVNEQNFAKILAITADTTKGKNLTLKIDSIKDSQLVTFSDQSYTCGNFNEYLQSQRYSPNFTNLEPQLKNMLDRFMNVKLLDYENTQLEKKYPDFARVYKEYHDGILLFNISKDKIWDVASSDTARLQKYYDQTTKKYYWNDRFKGWVIEAKNTDLRYKVETLLDGKEVSKQEITDLFNTKTENNVQINEVAVEKGENPVVDYYTWNGPKPTGFDEATTFVHGKVVKNEQKTLKDAWGLYSSDFQEQIEKEWIESLKAKYPVKVNTKVLKKVQNIE